MVFDTLAAGMSAKVIDSSSDATRDIDQFDHLGDIDSLAASFDFGRTSGHLIRMARERSVAAYNALVGAEEISVQQLKVLVALHQNGPTFQTELGEASGIDRSTIGEMIHRMVKRRLISRRIPTTNRRARVLSITATGRTTMRRLLPKLVEANEIALAPLSPAQRKMLFALLKTLCDAPLITEPTPSQKKTARR